MRGKQGTRIEAEPKLNFYNSTASTANMCPTLNYRVIPSDYEDFVDKGVVRC
jgi:hypothetical protein